MEVKTLLRRGGDAVLKIEAMAGELEELGGRIDDVAELLKGVDRFAASVKTALVTDFFNGEANQIPVNCKGDPPPAGVKAAACAVLAWGWSGGKGRKAKFQPSADDLAEAGAGAEAGAKKTRRKRGEDPPFPPQPAGTLTDKICAREGCNNRVPRLHQYDFVIMLNREFFAHMTKPQRTALIHHELCHCRETKGGRRYCSPDCSLAAGRAKAKKIAAEGIHRWRFRICAPSSCGTSTPWTSGLPSR